MPHLRRNKERIKQKTRLKVGETDEEKESLAEENLCEKSDKRSAYFTNSSQRFLIEQRFDLTENFAMIVKEETYLKLKHDQTHTHTHTSYLLS